MKLLSLSLLVGLSSMWCGCAGYRLGPAAGTPAGARSVQVNFFQNKTSEPRLIEAVNHAFRKRLQQEGTYRLNTRGDGDVVINGEITRFSRGGIAFQPGDTITARDFELVMFAQVTATERASGKVLLDRQVTGRTTIRALGDLASAERQAVPLLAEDLARNATSLLVDGTW